MRDRALTASLLSIALAVVAPQAGGSAQMVDRAPVPKGKHSPFAAAPLQKQAAHDKELVERYPV